MTDRAAVFSAASLAHSIDSGFNSHNPHPPANPPACAPLMRACVHRTAMPVVSQRLSSLPWLTPHSCPVCFRLLRHLLFGAAAPAPALLLSCCCSILLQLMYSDLDERNITELGKFDASVALAILEHYCSGDLSQVRNRRAYLAGVCTQWLGQGGQGNCRGARILLTRGKETQPRWCF